MTSVLEMYAKNQGEKAAESALINACWHLSIAHNPHQHKRLILIQVARTCGVSAFLLRYGDLQVQYILLCLGRSKLILIAKAVWVC